MVSYLDTLGYGLEFSHPIFWQWVRDKVTEGHLVFVSEYAAPSDFVCIFKKQQARKIAASNQIKVQEKLFIHESQV